MNPQVERLAKALKETWESDNQEHGTWGYKEKSQVLIHHGWIHKDEALDYVEVCPWCQGSGQHERGTIKCLPCQGWGVVKEDYCKHSFMEMCDFSKFSNAHNSKKCVKCGLVIKKNG